MKLARLLVWLAIAASLAPTACKKTEPPTSGTDPLILPRSGCSNLDRGYVILPEHGSTDLRRRDPGGILPPHPP